METPNPLKVVVTARMRVIATVKGHQLVPPEIFKHEFDLSVKHPELLNADDTNRKAINQIVTAVADVETRMAYAEHVIELIRTDVKIKRLVGGTAWSVEPMEEISRSMPGDPLNLLTPKKAAKVNKTLRHRCNGRLFAHECTADVSKDGGINGSGFCSKCYFPGIEDKYTEYKNLRTNGLTKTEAAKATSFEPYPFIKEAV